MLGLVSLSTLRLELVLEQLLSNVTMYCHLTFVL